MDFARADQPVQFRTGAADSSAPVIGYCGRNRARFLKELKDFVRFPSISAQPQQAVNVKRCAAWLAEHLHRIGLRVSVVPGARHPIIVGEWRGAPGRPTLLVYGHYDVQPPDPLEEWRTPPFEPTVIGNDLHGRGASDDKGPMFAHVKALECYLRTTGELPINVRCLFEGEEEIGSPGLAAFIDRHRRALAADVAVLSDTRMPALDRPALIYGLRAALSLDLEVSGQRHDVHSGSFGGAIHNPPQALCEIVAGLHDTQGRVAIPGFYDRVETAGALERAYLAKVAPTDREILRDAGAESGWGESGYSLYERTTLRPALTINGLSGGYQGDGPKAVIPARARVKLNFRLVPDQDPDEIEYLFRRHVARITPSTMSAAVRTHFRANSAWVDRNHPAMRAAALAYRRGFGVAPVFLRSGGTIPVVSLLWEKLGIPTVLMGFALADDGMHAPNEKFHLPNFFKGIATSIHFLSALAEQSNSQRRALELIPSMA
jgi:acetylornithine deacetylase/succinyl-diaminopimelate desuccinylase-like protein